MVGTPEILRCLLFDYHMLACYLTFLQGGIAADG